MDFGGPGFVVLIVLFMTAGWIINNWIRAKHGYALEDEWGGKTEKSDTGETKLLKAENARLTDRLDRTEDRLAVLEKIVTDQGYDVARQIEALRDAPAIATGDREKA